MCNLNRANPIQEVTDLIKQTRTALALRLIVPLTDPKFYEVRNHSDVFKMIQELAQEALGGISQPEPSVPDLADLGRWGGPVL